MELSFLLKKLETQNYIPQIYGKENPTADLLKIRIAESDQSSFDSTTLYLCSADALPSPETEQHFVIFCCGDRQDFSVYQHASYTICHFGTQLSQTKLFNLTLDQLTELEQITAGMHILVNALFSGNGLQYLVDTASHILGNPIYVIDLQNKYLAMSAGIIPDNTFFREESETGYISEKGILSIRKNKLDEKIRQTDSAYYCMNELVNNGMLVDSVQIQGIEVAHIMMLESEHPFREFDADFFHRFGKLISMELQKDSAYTRNKGVMYSYFLSDLLQNPQNNIEDVKERLSLLGYPLKETFYIIAIPPIGHTASSLQLELILDQVKHIFPSSIYVIYEETIVFLISRDMYQGLSEYELEQLQNYLKTNHLKAGISNFFQHLEDIRRFYHQAVNAVRLGTRLHAPAPLYYYSDYYVYHMLETFEKEDSEIRFLIHPGLMRLYLYDQEKKTDFIHTLKEYMIHPGQTSLVASNLHIHKNTLLYRLGKIKEIIGCELAVGDDFMNMNLSIMIMKYLGML